MNDTPTAQDQASKFLEVLHGHFGGWVHLFRRGEVAWFPASARGAIVQKAQEWHGSDLWISASSFARSHGPKRGTRDDVASVPALWLDLDIAGPGHKRTDQLPPDEEAAMGLLKRFGLAPTMVVHSGGGLQAWWVLTEPMSPEAYEALAEDWQAMWDGLAKPYVVDHVFDSTRLMRLPGTWNHKIDHPRAVNLLIEDYGDFSRYTLSEARSAIPARTPAQKVSKVPSGAHRAPGGPVADGDRPGDVFNRERSCGDVLRSHGWTLARTDSSGDQHWRRPGKREGHSATVYADSGTTVVWSDSVPGRVAGHQHDAWGLHVLLTQGGIEPEHFSEATRRYAHERGLPDRKREEMAAFLAELDGHRAEQPTRPPLDLAASALGDGFDATDAGNAARLVAATDGGIRYVRPWGKWVVYHEGRWVIDHGDVLVMELAKELAPRWLLSRASDSEALQHAKRSRSHAAIRNMVALARGIPGVVVDHEELDADPYLLNVLNGTVNLRAGQLRPHDPEDLITKQAPVIFDPNAQAPTWLACLETWQPDPEVRAYLQRAIGSAALGRHVEALFVCHGTGANGKSAFFRALTDVLGPSFVATPHKALLTQTRHEQHGTEKAALFGIRMLVASETESGAKLAEASIKELTGGDVISARRMREDPWSFKPTWTLFLHTNRRPNIAGGDEGIWRRVKLIPWTVTIPAEERDPDILARLHEEASGVLNWVVEGAKAFLSQGLNEPQAVAVATQGYRGDEDTVARFVAEHGIRTDQGSKVDTADLVTAHGRWCEAEAIGSVQWHYRRVTEHLKALGAERKSFGRSGRYWIGVTWEPPNAL